jgi:mono/diheme cytochrome c family protein
MALEAVSMQGQRSPAYLGALLTLLSLGGAVTVARAGQISFGAPPSPTAPGSTAAAVAPTAASAPDSGAPAAPAPGTAAEASGKVDLTDPARIAAGQAVWQQQCRHCHGRSAYPGKAPKLKPRKYTPDFVFDRVTNGFRKMPAWKDVYSEEQRWAVVAWVLSHDFSP